MMAATEGRDQCNNLKLTSLPNELFATIMESFMRSNQPVFFWLFRDILESPEFEIQQRAGRAHRNAPETWKYALPRSQRGHFLDWLYVTSTCQLFRKVGQAAFFTEKNFIIPPSTLRALQQDRHRSRNMDLAKTHIRHVRIPITSFQYKCDLGPIPTCNRFAQLQTLTLVTPDSPHLILENYVKRKVWPRTSPDELVSLLFGLGLRSDGIRLGLSFVAPSERDVLQQEGLMESEGYSVLRELVAWKQRWEASRGSA